MSDDIVTRAKAALDGITESHWVVEVNENGDPIGHFDDSEDNWDPEAWFDVDGPNGGWIAHVGEAADARFVAAARTLVPELVAELMAARAELALTRDSFCDHLDHTPAAQRGMAKVRQILTQKPRRGTDTPNGENVSQEATQRQDGASR